MQYPQTIFVNNIVEKLPELPKSIIDAPCGKGFTTRSLASKFPSSQVYGIDISEKNIHYANKRYKLENVQFLQDDIHQYVEKQESIEIFCLINSLFLLPEPALLLSKIKERLGSKGQLFMVLPNPKSENFKRYQKIEPDVNTFILEQEDYEDFFNSLGLKIVSCEGMARVPFFGRWDIKLLYPWRNKYLFWMESRSESKSYGYFLIHLNAI